MIIINPLRVRGKEYNLVISHHGNQMSRAVDKAGAVNHVGSMDFANDTDGGAVFGYDGNGALKYDSGRGIADIGYELCGNPSRIQFNDGSVTRYVYTAEGEKLRTAHYTAMPNMSVAMGTVHILSDDEILSRDSDEYVCGGTVVLRNGSFYEYRTAEGFFRISGKAGGGKPAVTAYYFNKDHLGNVREVVGRDGTACEVDNYYPFGMPYYEDASVQEHASFQLRKYCGKELDLVHGLNTYDHGARQNYSVLGVWDRVDPLAEKYYNISPYAVCGSNPIMFIDFCGTIIDTTQIGDDYKTAYRNTIADLRHNSQMFNALYELLEKSKTIITVKYKDHLVDGVNGYFVPSTWEVYLTKDISDIPTSVFSEEFFHAYQQINLLHYQNKNFNREFEAKVFDICVGLEGGGGFGNIKGMDDFMHRIETFTYGDVFIPITVEKSQSPNFLNDFKISCIRWAKYNIKHNFGNEYYRSLITSSPYSLQSILKYAYEKN